MKRSVSEGQCEPGAASPGTWGGRWPPGDVSVYPLQLRGSQEKKTPNRINLMTSFLRLEEPEASGLASPALLAGLEWSGLQKAPAR